MTSPEICGRAVSCFKVSWSIIERGTTSVGVTADVSFSTATTMLFCNVHVPKFLRNDNQRTGDLRPGQPCPPCRSRRIVNEDDWVRDAGYSNIMAQIQR